MNEGLHTSLFSPIPLHVQVPCSLQVNNFSSSRNVFHLAIMIKDIRYPWHVYRAGFPWSLKTAMSYFLEIQTAVVSVQILISKKI